MPKTLIKIATVAAFSLFASFAMAQAQAPAAAGGAKPMATGGAMAKPMATGAPMATAKTRTAKSLECSKEADAKGLHGKARKKFRSACKAGKAM